jgi:hypothetical protein
MRFGLVKAVLLAGLGIGAGLFSAAAQESQQKGYQIRYVDQRADGSPRSITVRRTVRSNKVERPRTRVIHRHVERRSYRPVRTVRRAPRAVAAADRPAQAVYYYDNTLVGRDPDANVRLMLLRDNARTMWAR